MTEFREVVPDFSVAGQLSVADIAAAAAKGFKTIINNRPDGEAPGQPTSAEIGAAAKASGLAYHALPFSGPPPPVVVAETAAILEYVAAPVLAYCRSGNRSITAWAMAQALSGAQSPGEIVALAAAAGYDLERAKPALETLAPRS